MHLCNRPELFPHRLCDHGKELQPATTLITAALVGKREEYQMDDNVLGRTRDPEAA